MKYHKKITFSILTLLMIYFCYNIFIDYKCNIDYLKDSTAIINGIDSVAIMNNIHLHNTQSLD